MEEKDRTAPLAPPQVAALRQEAAREEQRGKMERTISENIREEREDLREAAEHSLNVIMDLGLDGNVRWVSPSWLEVIGTAPESIQGKPFANLLASDKIAFANLLESMQKDDSRSYIFRFSVTAGPGSVLIPKSPRHFHFTEGRGSSEAEGVLGSEHTISLEAQGIMVYDRVSGGDSHTMWMIRPYVVREITIDLPDMLVESLGVGAEMLAHYLTALAEVGATDTAQHPPPPPILCRICERQITPWWFEKHTELCLQEHKAEMEVQLAQENLTDHRNAIVKVLDALEVFSRQPRPTSAEADLGRPPVPEYKGFPIKPSSTPNSGLSSGRASPASPPSHSRDRSSGFGHHRARSFHVRRPVSRMIELILDLCDTALEINTPAVKDTRAQPNGEFRTQSPQSENRISQVLQWQSPSTNNVEHEQGLSTLCNDTSSLSKTKIEAVFRLQDILEYSERIRIEFDVLTHECIEAAMRKAAKIASGELSDSTDGMEDTEDQTEEQQQEEQLDEQPEDCNDDSQAEQSASDEGLFPCSLEGPSSISAALHNTLDIALPFEASRNAPSVSSTRSSSPRGSQTPRSYGAPISVIPQGKRHSMHFESDVGADSDGSLRSSAISRTGSGVFRSESPGSELGLSRVATSRERERKRRSLILPSVIKSRQQSPARSMPPPPSSPLRMAKNRAISGSESVPSPVTSPVFSTSEFSSPAINAQHLHHRRQSSAASSQILGPPLSPRLMPISSNPQPRAVATSIKDFDIIKPISKGAFGSVFLAKKKTTGDYFAIKVLKKGDMVAKNQVTNVKAERAIMMWQAESDFVAKLYWTFTSKDFLYLVMEYLNGGDCASLIKVLGGLPEDWAKKYIAEVVLGIEHLHSRGIVHRDLKPDNLLIDQKGHLKLTDFGLSRMGLIGRQKRALKAMEKKTDEPAIPDLLKSVPYHRAVSMGCSRSASFDLQGNYSPSQTPSLTPAVPGDLGQPSYFSLNREASNQDRSRRASGHRSDSENSEALQAMFRRFSIADDIQLAANRGPIEEETPSEGGSPDPYSLGHSISHGYDSHIGTPLTASGMLPPPMALFDPQDAARKFVGTPDYLAPETIHGAGQDEVSDWWSLGCILFESHYGYPPFHADTPEQVFENILARRIDWPEDDAVQVSAEAKDLMNRLMCIDPAERLGANMDDKFASGGEEIRCHPWFTDVNWGTIRDDEASFVPNLENPEDTEYFDSRGATLQNFAAEFEDQGVSSAGTPGADYPERPHDALSRVRSQVNSIKRGLMPLHIPPHVRDGRSRRLSEPVATDDFGNFAFKNLPVLEKANKDVIQKLRAEAMQAQSKPVSAITSPTINSPSPSLDSSPILPMPLKRTMSSNKGSNRPASPLLHNQPGASPSRPSNPSSPLLVSFSTGQNHERRKTSSGSSTLSQATSNASLQPGNFFDVPKLTTGFKTPSAASSPIKLAKSPGTPIAHERAASLHRQSSVPQPKSSVTSPRARAQTIGSQGSQESDDVIGTLMPVHHKRRSQVFDVSPSSSDNEESRKKAAVLRVQRRRQSSRRLSQFTIEDGPVFRPLDVLVCEDHPVSRLVMEKLMEKLRCRPISVQTGHEALRYGTGEVKFDIIFMEFKLPQTNGTDVARMIRETKNANTNTPIVTVTGYLKELPAQHHFDGLIEKPPTLAKLKEILGRLCQWKEAPPNWTPTPHPLMPTPTTHKKHSIRSNDSPISTTDSYPYSTMPSLPSVTYGDSSREHSITSSIALDQDSRTDEVLVTISRRSTDEWRDRDLARVLSGLGISEEPLSDVGPKRRPISLGMHQASAPGMLEHPALLVPPKRRSGDEINAKRRSLEARLHDSAESGDDEDEELGDVSVRAKSPKAHGRPRGTSKLGTEMMRTNSHGSVVSVEDKETFQHHQPIEALPHSPPPAIDEEAESQNEHFAYAGAGQEQNDAETKQPCLAPLNVVEQGSLTPPELFPQVPGDEVQEIDMDEVATPKPLSVEIDPDPTPRSSVSRTLSDPATDF